MLRSVLLATAAAAAFTPAAVAQTTPAPQTSPAPRPAAPAPAQPAGQGQAGDTVSGVTVQGQRAFTSGIDRRSYSVANDLRATSGSVADALRNVPSVEVDVQGNVSLRGDPNVTILIDGRPSGQFQGEGRGDALQALPADQIDRVEVMTNPSAAFRPDGSGGVINLVTKQNRRGGRYGTVRANVGTGGRYNGGISGAVNSGKVNLSGDVSVRHETRTGELTSERARLVNGQFVENRQAGDSENTGEILQARAGIEYDPTAATRLSAQVRHSRFRFDSDNREAYEFEDAAGNTARAFDRLAIGRAERSNTALSTGYRRKFSGQEHELVGDFTLEHTEFNRSLDADFTNRVPAPGGSFEGVRNALQQDLARLKVDYSRPIGEARLKTGYEGEFTENDFANSGSRGAARDTAATDPNLTNVFRYEQAVHAVYGTFERPFGKLTAQGGLRLEQVEIELSPVPAGQSGEIDYFKAYPTLHLAYAVSEAQRLSASYSLRVQRPQPQDLNPNPVYIDPLNERVGDPRLEPQETHSFELGWQYRRAQTFYLATLYYRDTENGFTDLVEPLPDGRFRTTRANLGERRTAGLELVANGRLTPQLTYNVSGNLFSEEIEADQLGFAGSQSGASASGRANLNWQPTPNDFFQVNAFVLGRRFIPQGYREPTAMLNLGYRRKISEQLSLVFTAQDVFDSFTDTLVLDTPTFRERTERTLGARSAFVGFTYNFGQGPRRPQQQPGFEFDTSGGAGGPPS